MEVAAGITTGILGGILFVLGLIGYQLERIADTLEATHRTETPRED